MLFKIKSIWWQNTRIRPIIDNYYCLLIWRQIITTVLYSNCTHMFRYKGRFTRVCGRILKYVLGKKLEHTSFYFISVYKISNLFYLYS